MPDKGDREPGSIDSKGKQGDFKETRVSDFHTHKDGTSGYDQDVVINTYRNNEVVRTRQDDADKKYKGHTTGETRPSNDDSDAVSHYQKTSDGEGRSGK